MHVENIFTIQIKYTLYTWIQWNILVISSIFCQLIYFGVTCNHDLQWQNMVSLFHEHWLVAQLVHHAHIALGTTGVYYEHDVVHPSISPNSERMG